MIAGLDQLRPEHGDGLGAVARRVAVVPGGAVAQRGGELEGGFEYRSVDCVSRGLGNQGLAGNDLPGPMAGVYRGYAVLAQPLDEGLPGVVGIDGAQLGLY